MLPTMVGGEGYYISYTTDLVDLPDQELVDEFLPPFEPIGALDADNPMSPDIWRSPEAMMSMKYAVHEASIRSKEVIKRVNKKEGKKVGLVKIRCFRPFPVGDFQRLSENLQAIVAVSRHDSSVGAGAPVGYDVKSALYNMDERPIIQDVVSGICGVEISVNDFKILAEKGLKAIKQKRFEQDLLWYPRIELTEKTSVKPMSDELKENYVYPGTGACQGCGMTLVWRTVMEAAGRNTVYVSTSGCGGGYGYGNKTWPEHPR